MRVALILTFLMISASLAGCLGEEQPDYTGFEGCTEDETQCEVELPQENETLEEVEPPPPMWYLPHLTEWS